MRALVIACAFAAAASPAVAEEGAIRINAAGRDFSSREAVEGLHAQIERAARQVCGLEGTRLSARAYAQRVKCVAEKMDEAVQTANLPALSALHASLKDTPRG
jgi:UrcA family protein